MKIRNILFASLLVLTLGACQKQEEAPVEETAVPTEATVEETVAPTEVAVQELGDVKGVGSWQLSVVRGDGEDLSKEEHQSYYGEGTSVYTFNQDGTATLTQTDGTGAESIIEGTITLQEDGSYFFKEDNGSETVFTYDEETDTLHTSFEGANDYETLDFVFARAE